MDEAGNCFNPFAAVEAEEALAGLPRHSMVAEWVENNPLPPWMSNDDAGNSFHLLAPAETEVEGWDGFGGKPEEGAKVRTV